MIRCLTLVALTALVTATFAADDAQQAPPESGMNSIFNGKDLTGWDGDPKLWSVQDGAIRGETTKENPANGNTFIIWKDGVLRDFELRLSFRVSTANNSGIQYRSQHSEKGRNKWVVRGYQHEIRNSNTLPSVAGFIYDEGGLTGGRGRTCLVGEKATWEGKKKNVTAQLIDQASFAKLFKVDDWNDVVIIARGTHIQHFLNGRLILDFTDSPDRALTEGILAFQLHAGAPMWAEFKDLRIKDVK